MLTNSDITLYSYDSTGQSVSYTRIHIEKCFYQDCKRTNLLKSGLQNGDSVFISIPADQLTDGLTFTTQKDIVCKGNIDYEFDNTSATTISASLKALKALTDIHTVTASEPKLYGSACMQHYELSCE